MDDLAKTRAGGRNDRLNDAVFRCSQVVAVLSEREIEAAAIEACRVNGLVKDDGIVSVQKTIESAMGAGKAKPYDMGKVAQRRAQHHPAGFGPPIDGKPHGEAQPPTDGDVDPLGMPREGREEVLADQLGFKLEELSAADVADPHDAVATIFAKIAHRVCRYCHTTGAWYFWDGRAWRKDETEKALQLIRLLARRVSENELSTHTRRSCRKASFTKGAEQFARGDERLAVTSEFWDRDPLLLGTPGGTVQLRTGEVRPADPADGIPQADSRRARSDRRLPKVARVSARDHGR